MVLHTAFIAIASILISIDIEGSYKWLAVALAGICIVVFLEVGSLGIFHLYLSIGIYQSTLDFLKGKNKVSPHKANEPEVSDMRIMPQVEKERKENSVQEGKAYE